MRQSVPWSVKGVGPDARETAKELARRSGMTLGQWLNAMIAEQTSEREEQADAGAAASSPLASLASRLAEIDRRSSSTASAAAPAVAASAREVAGGAGFEPKQAFERVRATESRTADLIEGLMRRNADNEARTAQLIETLARSNREAETKTANALAAVAKWIEAAERAPKAAESTEAAAAVRAVAGRLDQIEAKLPKVEEPGTSPIRAAIDKLDERLSGLMGQKPAVSREDALARDAAELERRLGGLAEQMAASPKPAQPEPAAYIRPVQPEPTPSYARPALPETERGEHAARIESKLSRILDTLSDRRTGEVAPPAAKPITLDRAIDEISTRQRILDGDTARAEPAWPPRPIRPPQDPAALAYASGLDGVKNQIASLTREIAELRQAGRPQQPDLAKDPAITALRDDIGAVSRGLESLASQGGLDALESRIAWMADRIEELRQDGASEVALRTVEGHLGEIARGLSRLAIPDFARLEDELGAISGRLDRIAARGADASAIELLHRRIEEMARLVADPGRFEEDLQAISDKLDRIAAQAADLSPLDKLHRQLEEMLNAAPEPGRVEGDLRTISGKLDRIAAQAVDLSPLDRLNDRLAEMLSTAPDPGRVEGDLRTISGKLDRLAAQATDPSAIEKLHRRFDDIARQPAADLARLEGNLKGISSKLDVIAASGLDPDLVETLTRRLEQASRTSIGQQAAGLAADPAIAALRQDLAEVSRALAASATTEGLDALESRIAGLADRIDELRSAGASESLLRSVEGQLAEIARSLPRLAVPDMAGMQSDIRAIAGKLDLLASRGVDVAAIQRLQAQAEEIRDLVGEAVRPQAIEALAGRMDELGRRLDRIDAALARQAPQAAAPLEAMISQLAEKLDRAQRPGADERSLDALEQQINRMAERLEAAGSRPPDLGGIERSLADLFAQLRETRADALDAADDAAARAVRDAVAQLPDQSAVLSEDVYRHLADIRSTQDQLGRRTEVTLDAVQTTLERLAERMGQLERDSSAPIGQAVAEPPAPAPRRPEPAPEPIAAATPAFDGASALADLSLDMPLEPGTGGPRPAAQPAVDPSFGRAVAAAASNPDARRTEFIQAARRAAQAAALEAQAMAQRGGAEIAPEAAEPERETPVEAAPARRRSAARAGLGNRLRRRRVPILLGLAAVVMALGAYQVYDHMASSGEGTSAVRPTAAPAPAPDQPGVSAPLPAPSGTQPPADAAPKPQGALPAPDATAAAAPVPGPPAPAAPAADAGRPSAAVAPINPGVPSLGTAMLPPPDAAAPAAAADTLPARLQQAVKAEDPRALFDLATRLAAGGADADLKAAAQLYQRSGDKGFVPAQYRLGSMYEKGMGVAKDLDLARTWYQRAAAGGNIKAMHNLAVLYAEGAVDGKPDYAAAARWFRQAAERGLRDSEYNYAILVARGLGSTPDLPEAYKWFSLAAAQGDPDAGKKRDDVARRLDAATLAAQKAAVAGFKPQEAPAMANEATLPPASWATASREGA